MSDDGVKPKNSSLEDTLEPAPGLDKEIHQEGFSTGDEKPTIASFSMAHALSVFRNHQRERQKSIKEKEQALEEERREKAREKRKRRRKNQKLAKAKSIKTEAQAEEAKF